MENRSHALWAGIFVVLLGMASIFLVWWFSGEREETADYVLVTTGSVSGLNVQARVRYRGMAAGKVTNIALDPQSPQNILVTIRLNAAIPVTVGTSASLGYQGVTGLAVVELHDDGAQPQPLVAQPGELPRIPLSPGLFDKVTDSVEEAMQRFSEISERVTVLLNDDMLHKIQQFFDNLNSASAGIDQTFQEAPKTLQAVQKLFSDENQQRINRLLANLEKASGEGAPVVSEARQLLKNINQTLVQMNQVVENTHNDLSAETLPRINRLLGELDTTTSRMGQLIQQVNKTPQMLIMGRGRPAPGPGEEGFEQWSPQQ